MIALDLIEAEKQERWSALYQFVESCSTLPCPSLIPLVFLVPDTCLVPFFLALPLKFSPGDPRSLHLLAARRSCWFAVSILGVHVERTQEPLQ